MAKREDPSVYQGPGLWEGCLIVPAVLVVGLLSGVVVTLTDGVSNGLRVAFAGAAVGGIAWIALWELFSRLHPHFSQGSGERIKVVSIFGGPPLVALVTAVLAR